MLIDFIISILFFTISSIVAGYGEALRIKDRIKFDAAWHNLQWVERISIGVSCVLSTYFFGMSWFLLGLLIFFCIEFFIIYDGLINIIAFNRNFFYVSKTTKAWTEKFAYWWIKIPLLIIISIINILLFRNLKDDKKVKRSDSSK